MFIVGFLLGILSTTTLYLIIMLIRRNKKDKSESIQSERYIRRGLYTGDFKRSDQYNGEGIEYEVVAEIAEVERTKKKSKIEVIDIKTSITSDSNNLRQLIDIIEGWIDSDNRCLEWFEQHPGDERAKKIDGLLDGVEN